MPIIHNNDYQIPAAPLKNRYVHTLFARLLRPIKAVKYNRERIPSSETNLLDLDWSIIGSKSLAIVTDGLEGHSRRRYVRGAVTALNENGIDALAINFRGCSGEKSHEYFLQYGETDDLNTIVNHVLKTTDYENIFLVGCSVGGNLIMEYLGTKAPEINPRIKKAFVVSATLDLDSSCKLLHIPQNWLYLKSFLFMLFLRVWRMRKTFKRPIKLNQFFSIKSFSDFYDSFVYEQKGVPLKQYFAVNSSWDSLANVSIPCFLLYAEDDPFFNYESLPLNQAAKTQSFALISQNMVVMWVLLT